MSGGGLPAASTYPFDPRRYPAEVEGRQHHNVTLAILTLAGTAFALQQTMVIPALPALQRDLHTTTTWVTWVLTVFLLTASVATPILGKLGDQYGKGAAADDQSGCVPRRLDRVRGGVEHLVADRVPRSVGRRRGGVPAQLRDHQGRVPAREGRRGDRPGVRGVRCGRRLRDRAVGRDRGQP